MAIKFREITLECPCCANRFDTRAVAGASPIIRTASDFHQRFREGESVLPHLIHLCVKCGFCAEERFYRPEQTGQLFDSGFKAPLQGFAAQCLTPNTRWAKEFLVDRYDNALQLAAYLDQSPLYLGDLALRGAWAAVEERDYESERYFRRCVINSYSMALEHFDMVDRQQQPKVTYLVGEMWRRLAEPSAARLWYDRVSDTISDTEQQWVADLADRQRFSPQDLL